VNGRLTRIEMPEEEKNTLSFQNHHKQMKVQYVIYADFEALAERFQAVSLGQRARKKATQRSPNGMRHVGILTWL